MAELYITFILIGLIILAVGLAFLIQGAPFVTSNDEATEEIARLVSKFSPNKVLELGSGNGKVVLAIARNGINVDGIEINPILVFISRRAIKKAGLDNRARILWGSFWHFNIESYYLVTFYAVTHIMKKLNLKLDKELQPGSIAISNYFKLPNKKSIRTLGKLKVYKF